MQGAMLASTSRTSLLGQPLVAQQRRTSRGGGTVQAPAALFNPFMSEEARRKKEEEKKSREQKREREFKRQQEVLEARRSGTWRKDVAARRGQDYIDKHTGSMIPEPELPWAEQKLIIEAAAKAEEAAAKAAAQAAAEASGK